MLIVGHDAVEFLEQVEYHLGLPLEQRRAQFGEGIQHAEGAHMVPGRAQGRDHIVLGAPLGDLLIAAALQSVGR